MVAASAVESYMPIDGSFTDTMVSVQKEGGVVNITTNPDDFRMGRCTCNKPKEKSVANLKQEFDNLKNDQQRWSWIAANQHTGIVVYLDNDDTYGVIEDSDEEEYIFQLKEFVGSSDGIQTLLATFGINAQYV